MVAMFAGAAADPTVKPWWSGQVHLLFASLAIAINLVCITCQYYLIRLQGQLMDTVLELVNQETAAPSLSHV